MKNCFFIIILISFFFEATAQNRAIDTIWFRVPNVNIVDEGLFDVLDSIIPVFSQGTSKTKKKMVWYIMFVDDDTDNDSESEMYLLVIPSRFIIPEMKKADGFFHYKGNLVFIGGGDRNRHDCLFTYSNKTKSFYYTTINWELLWKSGMEESVKNRLACEYASIEDYPAVLLTRNSDGLWTWHFSVF